MKQLGDITKINGAEIEPVDCVCFGAPCQDLSVAGLRKGMKHTSAGDEETTRSGLFYEAIRVIKEIREHDRTTGRTDEFIGGFPLCWERCNGEGTARWASEIEEFPMAVTRERFSED